MRYISMRHVAHQVHCSHQFLNALHLNESCHTQNALDSVMTHTCTFELSHGPQALIHLHDLCHAWGKYSCECLPPPHTHACVHIHILTHTCVCVAVTDTHNCVCVTETRAIVSLCHIQVCVIICMCIHACVWIWVERHSYLCFSNVWHNCVFLMCDITDVSVSHPPPHTHAYTYKYFIGMDHDPHALHLKHLNESYCTRARFKWGMSYIRRSRIISKKKKKLTAKPSHSPYILYPI